MLLFAESPNSLVFWLIMFITHETSFVYLFIIGLDKPTLHLVSAKNDYIGHLVTLSGICIVM